MTLILKQDFDKKKRSNFLESDLYKYLVDKIQIMEYPNHKWFKGSRYR